MEYPENSFDFGNHGWKIDAGKLIPPEKGTYAYHYTYDKLFVSPDEKYACLFYTINEYKMGAQAGLIGVLKNKKNTFLISNPQNQWFDYQGEDSVYFFNDIMFLRKLAYNKDEHLSGTPFVVLNLKQETFGFIDFDWSSIYYSVVEISDTFFKFNLNHANEMKNSTSNRDGEEFDISTILQYSFRKLNNLTEIYFQEKSDK